MSIKGLRRYRAWLGAAALVAISLTAWLYSRPIPLREYVPWCGSPFHPTYIRGEVRERFMLRMIESFDSDGVEIVIRGGRIFTRGEGTLAGKPLSVLDIENNAQWKIVDDIARGMTIDDVYFPPPPALVEAIRATEPYFGPFPQRDEHGQEIHGPDPRFEDCKLMRAAILKQP